MIQHAIDTIGMFGLSYRSDAAVGQQTPPEIGSTGCLAKINAVLPLEEGRMNIITTGLVRYTVSRIQQSEPFLIASVETLADDLEPESDLTPIVDDVEDLATRFLEAARALDELNTPVNEDFPEEAEALSLLVSSVLPVDNEIKQQLLEITATGQRLARLKHYLTIALTKYERRISIQQTAKGNGHGQLKGEK